MKLCYVLPQYYTNSAENFYHISNFLEELGKKVELYVVIEKANINPIICNTKTVYVIDNGSKKISYLSRFFQLLVEAKAAGQLH